MDPSIVFLAYPSEPALLGQTIEASVKWVNDVHKGLKLKSWPQMEVPARPIIQGILAEIDQSDCLVADITRLNFNVTFEVAYAIAKQKRAVLILNEALSPEMRAIQRLGLFDTLGQVRYQNSDVLSAELLKISDLTPMPFPKDPVNRGAPVYMLQHQYRTEGSVRLVSCIKKSRLGFRSFDPLEQSRLSPTEAYRSVSSSCGVVVQLLSSEVTEHRMNNLRAAFLAGLSYGLEKETLIIQEGDEPAPIDCRDLVSVYMAPEDIDPYIHDFAPSIYAACRSLEGIPAEPPPGLLASLDLGSPAAENEVADLGEYYVATDEYNTVITQGARLAVGRKGSGKTALFFQSRDRFRQDRQTLVLDLKPEGHQLKRFKEVVLRFLTEAVQEHVAVAFWEYVLLLEICYKILEKDRQRHIRDHDLYEPYRRLEELYGKDARFGQADFSERMFRVVNNIADRFREEYGEVDGQYLETGQVTELVYSHNLPALSEEVLKYCEHKNGVVILFDNIDKGWPTRGIGSIDIVLLRALLEATRKLEQHRFAPSGIEFRSTVFVRNDVYELLVEESPDRGKESVVCLDWTDRDLLREFLRKRLVHSSQDTNQSFDQAWHQVCVSHILGEPTSEYLIDRCLMRPRNLLALVNHAKASAVNLQNAKITEDDIQKACAVYSADCAREIGLEIRDVYPPAEDILYCFIGAPPTLPLSKIRGLLQQIDLPSREFRRAVEILLWFAFVGVAVPKDGVLAPTFIYDVFYDSKKLNRLARDLADDEQLFTIHRAFWPFLEISPSDG